MTRGVNGRIRGWKTWTSRQVIPLFVIEASLICNPSVFRAL